MILPLIYVPFEFILIALSASGVAVYLASLYNPNKIHHIMQTKHKFKPGICELDCIKQSLAGGVEGRAGVEIKHRGYCKHGCLIETKGIIIKDRFHVGTSYHEGPCLA